MHLAWHKAHLSRAVPATAMRDVYTDHVYGLQCPGWHAEDSAWKASQILEMLRRHPLEVRSVAEIGCGSGGILAALRESLPAGADFHGYDIAEDAIRRARLREADRLKFHLEDPFANDDSFDLLLVIDVVEHVPDYFGFLERCQRKARFKIYHFPLDVHVSSVLRGAFANLRTSSRHLHYFTAESALLTLADTGHHIVDSFFTEGAIALSALHRSFRRTISNVPRRFVGSFSKAWAARLFGGYSLLVLAE